MEHAAEPFGTFPDAPAGAVLGEMLRRGYSAAVVVERSKHTIDRAADNTLWQGSGAHPCTSVNISTP